VQGIGGLGHLALQFAANMGFRTVALSRGADKEDFARHHGAHEYIDTDQVKPAEGLKRLGGADHVLATAPHAAAISSTIDGLKPRGKLLIVAAPSEPLTVSVFSLLSGKTVSGWPSGNPIDSEETMAFAALTGVRPRTETFKLDQAEQALGRVLENTVRFRAVLIP
jgi:propanol-preferring alcohol dehydrogenase